MVEHIHENTESTTTMADVPYFEFGAGAGSRHFNDWGLVMFERIVVQADLTSRPVRWYAELWQRDVKTLNSWCAKGWIPGAFKHPSGEWWVRPIDLLEFDPNNIKEQTQHEERTKTEGTGNRGKGSRRVQGTKNDQRTARLRYGQEDTD
jgi:hypothetical protein